MKETKAALKRFQGRSHYEVLEVDQSATASTIKKAYKEQALKWHPGKQTDKLN